MEVIYRFRKLLTLTILGLLLGIPPARASSLSTLITDSRRLAIDNGSSRNRFSDATITSFINEGQRIAVLEAKPILKSIQWKTSVNTTWYDLPSDFLQIYRVTHDNDVLTEKTPESLDKTDRWEETTGEPTDYFVNWSSRTKIGVYPWATSTSDTGTVKVEYFAQATDLSASSDQPFNSVTEMVPYHYGLSYFAAGEMAAIDGRSDLSAVYMGQFAAMVNRMKLEAKSRPSYRPGAQSGPR